MDFPGNSNTSKEALKKQPTETTDAPKREKIISGSIRKKSLGQKFADFFLDEGKSFGDHLIKGILIPMAKETILSVVENAGEAFRMGVVTAMFGEEASSRMSRTTQRPGTRIDYSRTSTAAANQRSTSATYNRPTQRRSDRVEEVEVENRADADILIEDLQAVIDDVGHCSVGDYYERSGAAVPRSTDEEWGWDDLRAARVIPIGQGRYAIRMPTPRPLNQR